MEDPLTYTQRFNLGAVSVRRECADQARRQAINAALLNDYRLSEMLHAEADRHEAAIIGVMRGMGQTRSLSSEILTKPALVRAS